MAQEKIKKGFFFYFGLFVLILIAVFMVCLVVMIFNPGKTILWMKYFTNDTVYAVSKTYDNQDIDLGTLQKLSIECSYADVVVKCNIDPNLKQEGIYIINHAKGFAGAKTDATFSFRAEFVGTNHLQITVSEPQGFLHFSKDVEIVVHSQATASSPNNFQNLALEVVGTADCDVHIGENSSGALVVKPKEVDVKTATGNVYFESKFDMHNSILSVETTKGSVRSFVEVDDSHKGISTDKDVSLVTTNGNINVDVVNAANLNVECISGNVNFGTVTAVETSVACKDGNYVFGTVNGKLTFLRSTSTIITPNIVIGVMNGEFDLAMDGTEVLANPNISIGRTNGNVNIVAEKGKLVVDNAKGSFEILSNKGFSSYITCLDDYVANNIKVTNMKGGDIKLTFKKTVSGNVATLQNDSGKTTVEFTSDANFTSTAVNMADETLTDGKIFLNTSIPGTAQKNPLTPNGGTGATMTIKTGGNVYYNLINKD